MADNLEWDEIEPLPWEGDGKLAAFYIGYQMGLERALEALLDDGLPKIAAMKVAELAVAAVMLPIRHENWTRAAKLAASAGFDLGKHEIAVTADGIKLRPLDLVERASA